MILDVMGVPDHPTTPDEHAAHAFAQAVVSEFPGDVFELARAIDAHLAGDLHGTDFQFANVNPKPLIEREGEALVCLALRFCGVRLNGGEWTDSPRGDEPTLQLTLPADLYTNWKKL